MGYGGQMQQVEQKILNLKTEVGIDRCNKT